jgi:hypothetical protein
MLTYQVPGVYRQDVYPPPPPVFLTAVPVFLGFALGGPVNEPVALRLWSQFTATFGNPFPHGFLAYAVRGFFENGGPICYVIRLDDALDADAALRAGLTAVSSLDDADLLCAPDVGRPSNLPTAQQLAAIATRQQLLLDTCRQRGDCFAILDAPHSGVTETLLTHRQQLNSDFGALYHSWLLVPGMGRDALFVPPCGHIAGIYARTDAVAGPHKAPANEELEGVLDLAANLTYGEVGELYAANINCLRAMPGRGMRVWGARTLSEAAEWQYINARRLFITVRRWLERFMRELPFEPHNPRLWVRITRELSVYLDGLYQQGAFKGVTPEQAYYVKCDGELNNTAVRDAGMVITEIGLAPAVPGEFIVTRIVHGAGGVTVTT